MAFGTQTAKFSLQAKSTTIGCSSLLVQEAPFLAPQVTISDLQHPLHLVLNAMEQYQSLGTNGEADFMLED